MVFPFRLFILIQLTILCFTGWAQNQIPGQILVQLNKESAADDILKIFPTLNPEFRLLSRSWNMWLFNFQPGDDENYLKMIQKDPDVLLAQFNHYLNPRSFTPNDTLFPNQWNLENTGQSNGTPGADISATDAWGLGASEVTVTGDTIVIAIIDEGFYLQHQDLRFWKNRLDPQNGIDDDLNGYIDDYNGWDIQTHTDSIPNDSHGTHIAGIAAAVGNNIAGITGVAWNSFLMPVSIPDYEEAQVVEAYSYIFDMRSLYNNTNGQKGAFVVATNSSFGWDFGQPEDYPIWCAMYDSLGKVGILSIGSTANITYDVDISGDIPSSCPSDHLIIATNTNRFDNKNSSAAFGRNSVDLGAPGTAIYSTTPFDNYGFQSGTSMSAAHVAGAVALMFSVACPNFMQAYFSNPDSISLILKDYILKGTDLLPDLDELTVSGGRLNLFNSMNMLYNDYCVACMEIQEEVVQLKCHGDHDAAITVNPSQGTVPYLYEWSTGDSVAALSGLSRGKYSVIVTDANGCEKYRYYEITQPSVLVANLVADSAVNGENGSAAVYVSGGTEPYLYEWDDPMNSTGAIVNGLPPGNYSVTVTDANNCQAVKSVTVGNAVGINTLLGPLIKIHPNPTSSVVWIDGSFQKNYSTRIILFDISGKMITDEFYHAEKFPLDLSQFPHGTYFLKIINEENAVVKKINRM